MKRKNKTYNITTDEAVYEKPQPMGKWDWLFIFVLITAYSIAAFMNLGNFHSPQTTWLPEPGEHATIDFGEPTFVTRIQFLMGARHDRPFLVEGSQDGGQTWIHVHTVEEADVFAWTDVNITPAFAQHFRIVPLAEGLRLQEFAFRGLDDELLPIHAVSLGAENLFDEQHLVPYRRYFMNSTFFDEIYHPRTGYEFVHGLTVFETTHPPLGKVFIAASVRVFGMTPFAWRLPGTLFGILMIPLLYAFARQILKSNKWGLFAAFIFTFDFMLFSQTRLATIDTYVTFFVLAMYFFMYLYTRGIRHNSLARSLVLLGLCGGMMGLAIASKWQGVYGALGLPFLFFPALYRLYLHDFRQAKITFFACFGLFVALPLFIYVLSYIPFVYASGGGGLRTIWENQTLMLGYHTGLDETHPFGSPWWSWPLLITPLWQYRTIIEPGIHRGMTSIGNPAVWWFGVIVTIYAIALVLRRFISWYKKSFGARTISKEDSSATMSKSAYSDLVFLLVAYAAQFLPWVPVSRLTFIYHYFPSVPFVVLIIAWFFKNVYDEGLTFFNYRIRRDGMKSLSRNVAVVYAVIVLALFVLFFPVLSGMPISVDFVDTYLRWLPGWIFV